MSLTQTPDNNFEGPHFSNGQTSRTTVGQITGMSLQDQFNLLVQSASKEKDEEIKKLKEELNKLKEENERLKQVQIDPQPTSGRYNDVKNKAENLKKVLDDFLDNQNSNRPPHYRPPPVSVLIPNPNVEVNKPSTSRPQPAEEPLVNGAKFRSSFPEEFTSRQVTDEQIVNQANPTDHYHFQHNNHGQTTLPTTYMTSQKRFNNNYPNGTNNNNNRNNRNNNNNNNNNSNKCTIFVSWPGSVTKEQLHELFENSGIDVADIRYTHPKQFAHVDLKSQLALDKAMALNGEVKNDKQGALRVEVGKPRSSNTNNPTENGQRLQNQNKNYNRQNNKNSNGYNQNIPQKPKYGNNNPNNYTTYSNNTNGPYNFATPEDKESSNNSSGWGEPPKNVEP
ncbi:hypothetical protein RclHR1_11230013 [Rhizophagus clarus]|uniref:RRM domain-containing protein n=1 Tax=Rhizophagus clarus TaxID=94130 RepID=A0A2Z6Q3U7_9GLOM|nr:hypothetical protein RclHR1_11230013 [Rhizophagus clarus]